MSTLSICMIVKNEESVLARCLKSIEPLADEIVIADTGSTDSTKRIASRFTDRVYDFPWNDDFSEARNFSFSKAVMDYIMWMDADDVFNRSFYSEFKALKEADFENADAVMMPYETAFDKTAERSFHITENAYCEGAAVFSGTAGYMKPYPSTAI